MSTSVQNKEQHFLQAWWLDLRCYIFAEKYVFDIMIKVIFSKVHASGFDNW